MILPQPGSFWHFDFTQIVLLLSVVAGVGKMWYALSTHPPHSHVDEEGYRVGHIADTRIIYPGPARQKER